MSKCDNRESIEKLRTLREKLCDSEKTWLDDACEERERTIDSLVDLHKIIFSSNLDIDMCKNKINDILKYLKIDLPVSKNS